MMIRLICFQSGFLPMSVSKIIKAEGRKARGSNGETLPRVRAVSRAIAIMRTFKPDRPALPLSRIAEMTALDAGTTRRILVTLRDEGIVAQDRVSGLYSLTAKVLAFSAAVGEERSLKEVASTYLLDLANEVGATVFLSIFQEDAAVCLARHHGKAPVQVRWWAVDGALPPNCGAAPRMLLAYQDDQTVERILAGTLPALTPNSLTDPDLLRKEIARIRKAGWSYAKDDVADGLSAVAAPVRDAAGRVIAAVSLGGLTPLIGQPVLGKAPPPALEALLRCCEQLTEHIS